MKKLKTSLNYLNTKYYSLIRRFSVYSLYITHPYKINSVFKAGIGEIPNIKKYK